MVEEAVIRYVAISSTVGHDYSFFLPIVGLAWQKLGYQPRFMLIGSYLEWKSHNWAGVPLARLFALRFDMEFIPHMDGVDDATIAQCVRQHAANLMFPDDDLLICSDADLIPIRREFYHQHDPDKHAIALFYSDGYPGEDAWHFPSCHYSMRVSTWREVMRLGDMAPEESMARDFAEYDLPAKMEAKRRDPAKNWGHVWFTDEIVCSKRIIESRYYPEQTLKIPREGHPPVDRLDRAYWPATYDASRYTDCHSLRPGWSDPNWPRLRPLLAALFPDKMDMLDAYRAEFRQAMGVGA